MKKVLLAVGIVSVMASTSAFALQFNGTNIVGKGVVGSKHDMNQYTETTKDSEGRVCAFCHTPHHALSDNTGGKADYLPLWSHKLTEQTGFNAYNSATVGVGGDASLNGPTILCMSCHDGVVAIDEHYNNGLNSTKLDSDGFGGTAIGLKDSNGATSFGNDHPIGFTYQDALAAHPTDLAPITTTFKGAGQTKTIQDQLTGGSFFTCATCHDVHNKDNIANSYAGPGARRNYFLMGDNNASQLCLTCHLK